MTEYVAVKALQRGMMVDLAEDEYATGLCVHCGDPITVTICDSNPLPGPLETYGLHERDDHWDYEYGVVYETEQETPDCIRVDFDNGDSIGFPVDHVLVVEGISLDSDSEG